MKWPRQLLWGAWVKDGSFGIISHPEDADKFREGKARVARYVPEPNLKRELEAERDKLTAEIEEYQRRGARMFGGAIHVMAIHVMVGQREAFERALDLLEANTWEGAGRAIEQALADERGD